MTATNYFSSDYKEARTKFLDACNEACANVESYKNPYTTPEGEPLYTDVAVLGKGDARVSLALGSGTHGVEGFCGSGIQNGLLREGLSSRLSPDLNVIMIHAINPYGFAYQRRFNEDNIDLNRNFVDHSKPYPQNPDYEALADAIAPAVYSAQTVKEAIKRLMSYGEEYGHAALQAAISGGQYSHPQGLFFGGQFETWSNKTFRTIVQGYLSSATRVAFIDIHTGLGPHGYGEVILGYPPGSRAYEYAVAWWGDRAKSTKAGESVSIELSGTVKHALSEMLPNAEHISVTLEFGTVPYEEVFQALQAENWLYHHGGEDNPLGKEIKAEMRRVFYPDTDDWKALVWDQGKEVVAQALAGLSI